jgi:hypothetical protein
MKNRKSLYLFLSWAGLDLTASPEQTRTDRRCDGLMHEAGQLGHDGHRREAARHDGLMCSAVQLGAARWATPFLFAIFHRFQFMDLLIVAEWELDLVPYLLIII